MHQNRRALLVGGADLQPRAVPAADVVAQSEAEARAAGLAAARLVLHVKGLGRAAHRVGLHADALVDDRKHDVSVEDGLHEPDRGAFGRRLGRVVDEVVKQREEQLAVHAQHGVPVQRFQTDAATLKDRRHRVGDVRKELPDRDFRAVELHAVGGGELQQLCGEAAQALGLLDDRRRVVAALVVGDGALDAQDVGKAEDARQRRFHLVRHRVGKALAAVGDLPQLLLALVDRGGHVVDAARERAQLGAAVLGHAQAVVAVRNGLDRLHGDLQRVQKDEHHHKHRGRDRGAADQAGRARGGQVLFACRVHIGNVVGRVQRVGHRLKLHRGGDDEVGRAVDVADHAAALVDGVARRERFDEARPVFEKPGAGRGDEAAVQQHGDRRGGGDVRRHGAAEQLGDLVGAQQELAGLEPLVGGVVGERGAQRLMRRNSGLPLALDGVFKAAFQHEKLRELDGEHHEDERRQRNLLP